MPESRQNTTMESPGPSKQSSVWIAALPVAFYVLHSSSSHLMFTRALDKFVVAPLSGTPAKAFLFSQAPASSTISMFTALALFVATTCYAEKAYPALKSTKRPSLFMRNFLCIHNAVLAIISGWLLLALLEHIPLYVTKLGVHASICSRNCINAELNAIYWANFLVKYLEWIDTAFLIALRKPRTFLHVYHHAATALLCWIQLHGQATVQWVPIAINLFVHVIMYTYYACCAINVRLPIKKLVTSVQVVQFIIDLCAIYYAVATRIIWGGEPTRQDAIYCNGTLLAAGVGSLIITSYLFMFIQFYHTTYGTKLNKQK